MIKFMYKILIYYETISFYKDKLKKDHIRWGYCLKSKQTIYNSLLSCRLAEGLFKSTLPKLFHNSDLNSSSMSPSNTLNTQLPPILSTRCANRNAIVEREICLA